MSPRPRLRRRPRRRLPQRRRPRQRRRRHRGSLKHDSDLIIINHVSPFIVIIVMSMCLFTGCRLLNIVLCSSRRRPPGRSSVDGKGVGRGLVDGLLIFILCLLARIGWRRGWAQGSDGIVLVFFFIVLTFNWLLWLSIVGGQCLFGSCVLWNITNSSLGLSRTHFLPIIMDACLHQIRAHHISARNRRWHLLIRLVLINSCRSTRSQTGG